MEEYDRKIMPAQRMYLELAEPLRNIIIDRGIDPHPDDNPIPLLYILDRLGQGKSIISRERTFLNRLSNAYEEANSRTRKELMQDIGDEILLALGLFPEALSPGKRCAPSLSFYANIGSLAYQHARSAAREFNPNVANLLENLAFQFCDYAGALWELEQLVIAKPETLTAPPDNFAHNENHRFLQELYSVLGDRVIDIKRGLLTKVPEHPIKVKKENKN